MTVQVTIPGADLIHAMRRTRRMRACSFTYHHHRGTGGLQSVSSAMMASQGASWLNGSNHDHQHFSALARCGARKRGDSGGMIRARERRAGG